MGKMNEMGSSDTNSESAKSAFNRMEEKVDHMMDEQNAMAELNSEADTDPVASLEEKYTKKESEQNVDDALAALKAEMGK